MRNDNEILNGIVKQEKEDKFNYIFKECYFAILIGLLLVIGFSLI